MGENNKHHASFEHELFKDFSLPLGVLNFQEKTKNVGWNRGGEQVGAKG